MNSLPTQLTDLADALRPALGFPSSETPPQPCIALARFAVERHRVGALLERAWESAEDDEVRAYLSRHLKNMTRRELKQKAAAMRLRALLDAQGIASREIKGWRLGEELYGQSTLRAAKDVDLLVLPGCFSSAIDLASRHGYIVAGEAGEAGAGKAHRIARYHREISILDPELGVEIELHSRTLKNPPAGWQEPDVDRDEVSALQDPDYVLYLIAHGTICRWNRLKWLCDLAMLTQKLDPSIRSRVMVRAKQLNFAPALLASLLLAKQLWSDCPTEPWIDELEVHSTHKRVQAHLKAFRRGIADLGGVPLPERILRHAEIFRDPPVFGKHRSRIVALRNNAMLWFLWKL
ncbi:nucleotidyltransferase family protein [Aurantiacibacter sp. MUD61]|uniref:nucleotidyltransferase family protein n=1 Tax=Aurantiacibacter sp. MUD61 TaxID=3009083 RepID=UPI0022F0B2D3|nr:nucleotidyltransferase family protein [Aurantiacibacter sp. MUD61]